MTQNFGDLNQRTAKQLLVSCRGTFMFIATFSWINYTDFSRLDPPAMWNTLHSGHLSAINFFFRLAGGTLHLSWANKYLVDIWDWVFPFLFHCPACRQNELKLKLKQNRERKCKGLGLKPLPSRNGGQKKCVMGTGEECCSQIAENMANMARRKKKMKG